MMKKRRIFCSCFDGFDYDKVVAYTEADVERIIGTEGMIKLRRKIEAVICNARLFQEIRKEHGSFSKYLWAYSGGKTILYDGHDKGEVPVRKRHYLEKY